MSNLIKEINAETGEETTRPMNEEELAQKAEDEQYYANLESKAQAQIAKRKEILERLGLTEDEAKLLLS